MTTGATGQLGLALPVQGELDGTWGDTVNNGITQYVNIAVAGTLTFDGDGAITLANTTGDASASNIGATTAQYMAIRVTGTLTTAKVITAPSYSKSYIVDNAATGSTVTFKAAGQTGISVAAGEKAVAYFNGTDYVKISSSTATAGFVTLNGVETLTNKRITPRINSQTTISSPWAWNSDSFDQQQFTALANALTISADAGTPTDGQKTIFRFLDNGTARALTWTTGTAKSFRAVGVTLPTTTVPNKTTYVGCIYNSNASRWDAVAALTEI
jgi:hypothetical protein